MMLRKLLFGSPEVKTEIQVFLFFFKFPDDLIIYTCLRMIIYTCLCMIISNIVFGYRKMLFKEFDYSNFCLEGLGEFHHLFFFAY